MLFAFDMDGVLFDFQTQYAAAYTKLHPDDPITASDIIHWDVTKCTKYLEKDIWKKAGFYETMPAFEEWAELFRWCYATYPTIVVTTCPPNLCHEKITAMKRICPEFNEWDIFFCNRKELINFDYIFDDANHHIMSIPDRCVAVTREYNKEIITPLRVNSANEARLFIENRIHKKGTIYDNS